MLCVTAVMSGTQCASLAQCTLTAHQAVVFCDLYQLEHALHQQAALAGLATLAAQPPLLNRLSQREVSGLALDATLLLLLPPQVVVIAKVLEARPSFSNLFGLRASPSKTSLSQHSASALDQQPGGGLTPPRTSRQWDGVQEDQGRWGEVWFGPPVF
jgi:hypothetical protein